MMPSSDKLSIHEITQLGVLLAAAIALRSGGNQPGLAAAPPRGPSGPGQYGDHHRAVPVRTGEDRPVPDLPILLTGLLFTGLLTPGFLIGLGGAALSFGGMALARKHQWFSTVGVGLLGAFLHNCGPDPGGRGHYADSGPVLLPAGADCHRHPHRPVHRLFVFWKTLAPDSKIQEETI